MSKLVIDAEFEVSGEEKVSEIPPQPKKIQPPRADLDSIVEEAKAGKHGDFIRETEQSIKEARESGKTGDAMMGEAKAIGKIAWKFLTGD